LILKLHGNLLFAGTSTSHSSFKRKWNGNWLVEHPPLKTLNCLVEHPPLKTLMTVVSTFPNDEARAIHVIDLQSPLLHLISWTLWTIFWITATSVSQILRRRTSSCHTVALHKKTCYMLLCILCYFYIIECSLISFSIQIELVVLK